MNKKTRAAIKVLEKYRSDLVNVSDTKSGNNWKAKVLDSLKQYIGEHSSLYNRMYNEVFTDKNGRTGGGDGGMPYSFNTHDYNPNRKQNFENLVNEIIEHITYHGLKENYVYTNFLSKYGNGQLIGWIGGSFVAIVTAAFILGGALQEARKDREYVNLSNENLALRAEIKILEDQALNLKASEKLNRENANKMANELNRISRLFNETQNEFVKDAQKNNNKLK